MQITARTAPPAVPPDLVPTGEVGVIATRQGVELQLEAVTATVVARPWYWHGGKWQPARADGAAGVGVEPVTADPTKYGGKANGLFLVGPVATSFCVVLESGSLANVVSCDLSEYFVR